MQHRHLLSITIATFTSIRNWTLFKPVHSLSISSLLTSRTIHHGKSATSYSHFHYSLLAKLPLPPYRSQSTIDRSKVSSRLIRTMSGAVDNASSLASPVSISEAFDGGNGQLVKAETNSNGITVYVNIRPDPYTELEKTNHFQYFSFRSTIDPSSVEGMDGPIIVKYIVQNAGKASYVKGWEGGTIFFSTTPNNPHSWTRKIETKYDTTTGELSWTHTHLTPGSNGSHKDTTAYFSYFPPYSYERHLNLIAQCDASPSAMVTSLGQTIDGREMDCIKIGTGERIVWVIHRQHPGESMAEFYAEGLLNRLLGLDTSGSIDGCAIQARDKYTFYIVPNMCPDGSVRGHLRTNAGGQNLNREWMSSGTIDTDDYYEAPTIQRSPEVYHVLKKMDETGVDAFFDIHGDEALPFNFLAGSEGCPNWSQRLESLHGAFLSSYERANSDMQIPVAYDPESKGEGRLNVCSNQIAYRFDCLAATLEMPFKDCATNSDPERGWNPARSIALGASLLDPLVYVHKYLRTKEEFWVDFSKEDAYVRPNSDYE